MGAPIPVPAPEAFHPDSRESALPTLNMRVSGSSTVTVSHEAVSTARTTTRPSPPSEPLPVAGLTALGTPSPVRHSSLAFQRKGCDIPRSLTCGFPSHPVNPGQLACLDFPFPPFPSMRKITPSGETAPSRNAWLLQRSNCFHCLSRQPGSPWQSTWATTGAQLFLLPLPRSSLTHIKRPSTRQSPEEYLLDKC